MSPIKDEKDIAIRAHLTVAPNYEKKFSSKMEPTDVTNSLLEYSSTNLSAKII
jgi:hypothetical protein